MLLREPNFARQKAFNLLTFVVFLRRMTIAPPRASTWECNPCWQHLGTSVEGRELHVRIEAPERDSRGGTLIVAGLHGDERGTIRLVEDFCVRFMGNGKLRRPVAALAIANPDGYHHRSRYNARGVDLNRNCGHAWTLASVEPSGPAPWSEPEMCALRDFILQWQPRAIVSLHWALSEIDADGTQSRPLAEAMWNAMTEQERKPYRLRVSDRGIEPHLALTYAQCPGSLGQWCGYGLHYPDGSQPMMVTLELPYNPDAEARPDDLPADHLKQLQELWHRNCGAYLRAVEPAVHKMLLAACHFEG
jgi:hypothetical protein